MKPPITIIASSYLNKYSLLQMVCNFRLQTRQDFILEIVHDGKNEELKEFIEPFLADNMFWNEVDGPNGKGNFKGRNIILDKVTTPYVMFASDDNYYVDKFFEHLLPHVEKDFYDMMIFKCLHNVTEYVYEKFELNGTPAIGGIDLCQFVVRTELIHRVNKFQIFEDERHGTEDGDLCERLMKLGKLKVGWMQNCFLVHN